MFACSRFETGVIMNGKACGVIRRYDSCPYSIGDQIVFTSKFLDNERNIPFAKATIVSIRPGTLRELSRDDRIVEYDGYSNGTVLEGYLSKFYGGTLNSDSKVYHLKFRIDEMDKLAGTRGDVDDKVELEDNGEIISKIGEN